MCRRQKCCGSPTTASASHGLQFLDFEDPRSVTFSHLASMSQSFCVVQSLTLLATNKKEELMVVERGKGLRVLAALRRVELAEERVVAKALAV